MICLEDRLDESADFNDHSAANSFVKITGEPQNIAFDFNDQCCSSFAHYYSQSLPADSYVCPPGICSSLKWLVHKHFLLILNNCKSCQSLTTIAPFFYASKPQFESNEWQSYPNKITYDFEELLLTAANPVQLAANASN